MISSPEPQSNRSLPLDLPSTAIRAGDRRTFDRLYGQYAPRVLGYLIRLTNSRTEAEDLTQETFLAAFDGRTGFNGRSQPLAWLLGIAWRRWRDARRTIDLVRGAAPLDEEVRASGSSGDPADNVATAATLDAALRRLPVEERDALLLTAVQGLTYKEAAQILGEPVGTIKWRVHEATKRLRQQFQAAEEREEALRANATNARRTPDDTRRTPQRATDTARSR